MQDQRIFKLLNVTSEDELFDYITSSFKEKITTWDYFVNWNKVKHNIREIETELNLLNVLVGKKDFDNEAKRLISSYPQVIKTFPALLASRDTKFQILEDTTNFIYKSYDFTNQILTDTDVDDMVHVLKKSGIADLLINKEIKNLVDYVTGVEAGLDSNARKNRGGVLMEKIVAEFLTKASNKIDFKWMEQATARRINKEWNMSVEIDPEKTSRKIDFAILYNDHLYFLEVNFYGGGGSKLKSTAGEYTEMNRYWKQQGITFIWITDGAGWKSTRKPLHEYFDEGGYLANLELLQKGFIEKILS